MSEPWAAHRLDRIDVDARLPARHRAPRLRCEPERCVVLFGDAEGKASLDARTWLRAHHVEFVDRDLAHDRLAGFKPERWKAPLGIQ
jgi:hypothetical protein